MTQKLVESYKKLGSQIVLPEQLLEDCVRNTEALQTNHFLSGIIEEMRKEIPEIKNEEVVVVHGDVNHKNWLVDDNSGKIYLVDWDTVFYQIPWLIWHMFYHTISNQLTGLYG